MKRVVWLCVLVFLAVFSWWVSREVSYGISERERLAKEAKLEQEKKAVQSQDILNEIQQKMVRARSPNDWKQLLADDFPRLGASEQKKIGRVIRAKTFEANFWRAEVLLSRVRGFLEQDKNHPVGRKYREDAKKIYQENEKLLEGLTDNVPDASLKKAYLHYLLGVFYYRSLFFIDPQKEGMKAKDLVERSITNLAKVFEYIPKDRDTEVALELLQKNAQSILSAAQAGDERAQLRLLPKSGQILSPFAMGDREKGRH